MSIQDAIKLMDWSHPMQVNTKRGARMMKKAPIGKEFWDVYREDKELCKKIMGDAGVSLGKFRDLWQLTWWSDEELKFRPIIGNDNVEQESEPDEEIVLPPLMHDSILFEYQKTSVQLGVRSIQRYNRVLLGHSTGVGKTFCALGIARELGKRVAVVCPKPITTDWHRAAKTMGVETFEVSGWEWVGSHWLFYWLRAEGKACKYNLVY